MLTPCSIDCPYCGESIEILLAASLRSPPSLEDCQVCCRPIPLRVAIDAEGEPQVHASGENEA